MLCQFTFKNFKSFKNEAFLDFYAENISEMKETLIKGKNDDEFLPVISLYGPNGGGKSTVLGTDLSEKFCFISSQGGKPILNQRSRFLRT